MMNVSSSSHRSQVLVSEMVLAAGGRGGKGKKGAAGGGGSGLSGGPSYNEEGFLEDDQYVSTAPHRAALASFLPSFTC